MLLADGSPIDWFIPPPASLHSFWLYCCLSVRAASCLRASVAPPILSLIRPTIGVMSSSSSLCSAMVAWGAVDWREYGERVCGAFTERLQHFMREHEQRQEQRQSSSRPKQRKQKRRPAPSPPAVPAPSLPKDSPFYIDRTQQQQPVSGVDRYDDEDEVDDEEADDGDSGDGSMAEELTEAEETELRLIVASFTRDVSAYLDERLLLNIGMDDRVLLALRTLNAVCKHVLSHGDLLSLDAEIALLALFPDIAGISNRQLTLWLEHQKAKLSTLLSRVIAAHAQHAAVHVDESTPFAASVLDNFTILSATATGYFEHLDRLAPFVSTAAHDTTLHPHTQLSHTDRACPSLFHCRCHCLRCVGLGYVHLLPGRAGALRDAVQLSGGQRVRQCGEPHTARR